MPVKGARLFLIGEYMSYSAADIAAIKAKAVEIAKRGVSEIVVGDRTHKFSSPQKMLEFAESLEASNLDNTYSGRIPITMGGRDG